jgi:ribosomal protein S18 acetylase RimI-like enzyme
MLDIVVKPAISIHISACVRISRDCYGEEKRKTYRQFQTQFKNHVVLVALLNNVAVGYSIHSADKSGFQILDVAVVPDYRRKGIGRQLINKIIHSSGQSPAVPRIFCTVTETDIDSMKFFSHCGLAATGHILWEKGDGGLDAYEMALDKKIPMWKGKNRITVKGYA